MEDLEDKDDFYSKFRTNLITDIPHLADNHRFDRIKFEINSRLDDSEDFSMNYGFDEGIADDAHRAAFDDKAHIKAANDHFRSIYLNNHQESEEKYDDSIDSRKRKKSSNRYIHSDSIKEHSNHDQSSYKSTKRVRINSDNELVKLVDNKPNLHLEGKSILTIYF